MVMFPIMSILILCLKKKAYKKKTVFDTIGAMYNEQKPKYRKNLLYVFSFWLRRIALTLSVLYMS